jgi:hypothetical protein
MGFLDNLIGLISGGNDPEAAKKKRLHQLVKDLSQNKYSRFYRAKGEELEPAFGKFLYDIYKVVSPAQVFLQNAAKSEQLKQITVDAFLDKDMKALKDKLSAAAIQEKTKTTAVKELSAAVKRDLSAFVAGFDSARVNSIDSCYNTIIALVDFVCFDFFLVLKKFDSNINERNFS